MEHRHERIEEDPTGLHFEWKSIEFSCDVRVLPVTAKAISQPGIKSQIITLIVVVKNAARVADHQDFADLIRTARLVRQRFVEDFSGKVTRSV